ncbi:unnamed protein product [Callosobruchus maculatus]|uniref:SIAH-type domain-containing protein n=1 Tax=Callosobruchus maculatus TaxID=64391 RepID=A0A653DJP4_CALMS|nr:unnamed protein product [Callosobruchus maculatus]
MNRSSSTTSSRTFLSPCEVGPITHSSDSTSVYRRCPITGDYLDDGPTNLFLPCRLGCNLYIRYGDILWHEDRCKFKPIACPAVGCDLNVTKTDLLRHFREKHLDLIMTTRDLQISAIRNFENRLYVWKNRPLVVQTRILGIFLYIRLSTIENKDINIRRLFYRVKLLNKTVPVPLYSRKMPEIVDMLKLDSRLLGIQVHFDIYDRKYERLTSRYLDNNALCNLRCSNCQFYTLPTTYTCRNRHNFCKTCFNRLQVCTVAECQTSLKEAFSLKHLGPFIELPCHFKNCTFVQNPQEVTRHEQAVHVWNLSEVEYFSIGEDLTLDMDIEGFDKTLYADCQGTLLKIIIKYTKGIGMTTSIIARDSQYVGLKYDLEVSGESQKLRFEGQIVDIDLQNVSEHYVKVDTQSLEHVMDSSGRVKLRFRLISYR